MTARILNADVFDALPTLPPGSVDCVVTSPPYWNLRSYLPNGHAQKPQELGSEPTPEAYVAAMVRVFRLVRAALADHGTCWINCGDSYSSGCSGESRLAEWGAEYARGGGHSDKAAKHQRPPAAGLAPGNLCLIPWRLALALQSDGWLVRSVVVWHKPAPMPASLAGWRWQRCRVKVGNKPPQEWENGWGGRTRSMGGSSQQTHKEPLWQDCPGCDRCRHCRGYAHTRTGGRP